MNVLLTGFNAFMGMEENSSEIVINEIKSFAPANKNVNLTTHILKTEFLASANKIRSLIQEHKPDLILMLGMAKGHDYIRLERRAINKTGKTHRDNTGACFTESCVVENGAEEQLCIIDIEKICDDLSGLDIPAQISESAGDYVCNHAYYHALDQVKNSNLESKALFIHLPDIKNENIVSKDKMVKAINKVITSA